MSEPKTKRSKSGERDARCVDVHDLKVPGNIQDRSTPICRPTKMPTKTQFRMSAARDMREMRYLSHPCRIISRYNFKGGVGKTTSTFSLGYKLAEDERVMLVDADIQCNLTQLILRRTVSIITDNEDYDAFFQTTFRCGGGDDRQFDQPHTLAQALWPVLMGGNRVSPAQLVEVGGHEGLFLLAGDSRLQAIESRLARGVKDPDFKNVLGVFYHTILRTAHAHNIGVVLIDLPPSLSAITRIAMMSSDYLMIPYTPDFFSCQAVRLLTGLLCDEGSTSEPPSQEQLGTLEDIDRQLSAEFEQSNWLQWLEEKQQQTRGTPFPMPVSRILKDGVKQGHRGPRLLGAQLTRFVECKDKEGVRKLVVNAHHWQQLILEALQILNARLPAELRMPNACAGNKYWGELDKPGLFENWHEDFGLTVGRAAEYYQLSSISQRESLPVLALRKELLVRGSLDEVRGEYKFKRIEPYENALRRIETDDQDYNEMVARLEKLFEYFDRASHGQGESK